MTSVMLEFRNASHSSSSIMEGSLTEKNSKSQFMKLKYLQNIFIQGFYIKYTRFKCRSFSIYTIMYRRCLFIALVYFYNVIFIKFKTKLLTIYILVSELWSQVDLLFVYKRQFNKFIRVGIYYVEIPFKIKI